MNAQAILLIQSPTGSKKAGTHFRAPFSMTSFACYFSIEGSLDGAGDPWETLRRPFEIDSFFSSTLNARKLIGSILPHYIAWAG